MKICSAVTGLERLDGAFLLHTNCADIKLYFVTDEIIRVRASFDKELAEGISSSVFVKLLKKLETAE